MADYKWDCINTKITEIDNWDDQSPSWCKPGIFQPAISRVKFNVSSHANKVINLSSIQSTIFSSVSDIMAYPPCELPINMDAYNTSSGMLGLTYDGGNLYVGNQIDKKVYKMLGQSGELFDDIDFPVGKEISPPWYFRGLYWHDGRLVLQFWNSVIENHFWLEMDGFTNTIYKELILLNQSYPSLIGQPQLTFMTLDPINNWIVGVVNGYRATGGYRQRIVRWDYTTGAAIGGDITSTIFPISNNFISQGFIDYSQNMLYCYNTSDDFLYAYDYTVVTKENLVYPSVSTNWGGNYKGGDRGLWWSPNERDDLWVSGSWSTPAGSARTWKYISFAPVQQFCGQGEFNYFTSTANISSTISNPVIT